MTCSSMQQNKMKRGASGLVKVILCQVIKTAHPQIQREAPAVFFLTDGDAKNANFESGIKSE